MQGQGAAHGAAEGAGSAAANAAESCKHVATAAAAEVRTAVGALKHLSVYNRGSFVTRSLRLRLSASNDASHASV